MDTCIKVRSCSHGKRRRIPTRTTDPSNSPTGSSFGFAARIGSAELPSGWSPRATGTCVPAVSCVFSWSALTAGVSTAWRSTERCLLALGGFTESSELVRGRLRGLRDAALGTNILKVFDASLKHSIEHPEAEAKRGMHRCDTRKSEVQQQKIDVGRRCESYGPLGKLERVSTLLRTVHTTFQGWNLGKDHCNLKTNNTILIQTNLSPRVLLPQTPPSFFPLFNFFFSSVPLLPSSSLVHSCS